MVDEWTSSVSDPCGSGARAGISHDHEKDGLRREIEILRAEVAARDQLLSVAAHELRNPINAIALQISVAKQMAMLRGDQVLAERLKKTNKNLQWLLARSVVLLDVTRTAAGLQRLELGCVDLREVIRQVEDLYLPYAEAKGTTLKVECSGQLTGQWDSLALEQILANLVSNAIKFGNGAPVLLSAYDAENDSVCLRVSDGGGGISAAEQQRIQMPFYQAMLKASKLNGGFGLGLWLARSLVRAHDGSFEVLSRASGSTFTITLPKFQKLSQGTASGTGVFDHGDGSDRIARATAEAPPKEA